MKKIYGYLFGHFMPEIKLKPIMVLTSFMLMLFLSFGLKAQTTEFSPEVSVSLSTYEAGEIANLTFSIRLLSNIINCGMILN